ncbi:hypothetical protein N665_0188s0044, partial [Sinapis alba]
SCIINHYSYQSVNGMVNTWIQALTCLKHTKTILLIWIERGSNKYLEIPTNLFSYPSLKSLSLTFHILESSHLLSYCPNLTTLKTSILLASCPSLEVLVLNIICVKKNGGPLKIENNNKLLKVLLVTSCTYIDSIIIIQEKKIILHEELVNLFGKLWMLGGSLSVTVDLNNPTEFERLQKVLRAWRHKMGELEIIFKDNNDPNEENDSWNKKKNKYKDPFPNAEFHVDTVCMYNFSGSEDEFALASCLIKQGTVVTKMMIKTTSFPAKKKLEIKTAATKLRALRRKDQRKLTIKCF